MLFSKEPFCFPSLKCPHTPVLLTAVFWELSPAGRCYTSRWREWAEARRSREKHPPCSSQLSSHFAGHNPFVFRDETRSNVFRGPSEGSKVVIKPVAWTQSTAIVSRKSSLKTSFWMSAPLQHPIPGFLRNKRQPFDAEVTTSPFSWLKLEQQGLQYKTTAENRSSPADLPRKKIFDEVSGVGRLWYSLQRLLSSHFSVANQETHFKRDLKVPSDAWQMESMLLD